MSKLDFLCLLPLLILAGAPVIIMLGIVISRNFRMAYLFTLLIFIACLLSLFAIMPYAPHAFYPLLILDGFSILFLGIIYIAAILVTILSYEYFQLQQGEQEEYFIVLIVAVLGSSILVIAEHFISFFLGLEILSVSLYILISFLRWRDYCIEAGVKFIVISSLATAFLLFGMGLVYAATGTMNFHEIFAATGKIGHHTPVLLAGFGLILTGIGFELALVPFHMWTPDVYQGAPVPVTTFIATISKGAMLALALRLFIDVRGFENENMILPISIISVFSMFAGNLLALRQRSLKRMLAYSSIAHLGYLLITLLPGTTESINASIFYLFAYVITSLGAFGVLSGLSVSEKDADNIEDLTGLFRSHPLTATVLAVSLISLAGLPLTAGFISKFYIVLAGAKAGYWVLAFSLIINSIISLYYYLNVIRVMFGTGKPVLEKKVPVMIRLILLLIMTGILFLGIMPSFLSGLISSFSAIN